MILDDAKYIYTYLRYSMMASYFRDILQGVNIIQGTGTGGSTWQFVGVYRQCNGKLQM